MNTLRRMLPSMNSLSSFEAAARCGNFSKAAEELNVTPAAVSRMMTRLERHLQVQLFERIQGGVVLTEIGQLLFNRTSRSFHGIEHALREIADRRAGMETVSLSISTGFTTHWLMPRMAKFKKRFPNVDLRFQLMMGPITGPVSDVDLGMRYVDGPDSRHEAAFVMPEILLPICSPVYREDHAERRTDVTALHDTIVNLSDAEPEWSSLFSPARDGDTVNSLIFSDYAIVVQAALLGQGVALGWLTVVSHWLRIGSLVPASHELMRTGRLCHLVRARDRPLRPIVSEISEWIIAELHDDIVALAEADPEMGYAAALERR